MASISIAFDFACPESRVLIHRLRTEKPALEVDLLPLRLDPLAPADYGHSTVSHLCIALDVSEARAREMLEQTEARFAIYGLSVDFDSARGCNTLDAHVLVHHAQHFGLHLVVASAIFDAHFAKGLLISDPQVLVEIAKTAGLDEELAVQALNTADTQIAVLSKESDLIAAGIGKTPTVFIDGEVVTTDSLFC